jgi:phosphatidate cytidylyltransferase
VGGWPFAIAIGLVAIVGAWECYRLLGMSSGFSLLAGVSACGVISMLPIGLARPQPAWIAILLGLIGVSGVLSLVPGSRAQGTTAWTAVIFPPLYVGVTFGLLHLLRHAPRGAWWVALILLITWAYDTGAYFAGSRFGRHSFMQHVSAKKTWEGVAGGLVLSTLAGLIAVQWLGLLLWQAAMLGAAGGVVSQLGDLVESMLKRSAGVKDSGAIVPGHGGLLDRVDSLLWTGALGYCALVLLGHGT